MYIVELHRGLQQARNEEVQPNSKYRIHTAATAVLEKDASELLESGVNPDEVSDLLNMPLSEVARIQEHNRMRRKYLTTGDLELPNSPTVFGVFNGLPSRR